MHGPTWSTKSRTATDYPKTEHPSQTHAALSTPRRRRPEQPLHPKTPVPLRPLLSPVPTPQRMPYARARGDTARARVRCVPLNTRREVKECHAKHSHVMPHWPPERCSRAPAPHWLPSPGPGSNPWCPARISASAGRTSASDWDWPHCGSSHEQSEAEHSGTGRKENKTTRAGGRYPPAAGNARKEPPHDD